MIQDPLNTIPFLSYRNVTNNAINQIAHILQQSTTQPLLPILPLPLMLPQIHAQIPFPAMITHPAAPDSRVEPFLKNTKVKPSSTAPTSPPRVQHATPPTLDPLTNPWI